MKPRLIFRFNVWSCAFYSAPFQLTPIGYGYTPAEAFEDWLQQAVEK